MAKLTKKGEAMVHTAAAYGFLTEAYNHFNRELFGGTLPQCLITLQRHAKAYGYFAGNRFSLAHGGKDTITDEIAMNPKHFAERTPEQVLATLVHEMVHLWQKHFGKEPSRCYHDKQWAAKMKDVGLHPSRTGLPGGKETGPQVTHYIIERGVYAKSCAAFLKENKPSLYQDIWSEGKPAGKGKGGEEGEGEGEAKTKSKGRAKFTCPGCKLNAWAKPTAKLGCLECKVILECVDGTPPAEDEED